MSSALDKELDEDIEFLNDVRAQLVQASLARTNELDAFEAAMNRLPPADVEKLAPQARDALRFIQNQLPTLRELFDWRALVATSIEAPLREMASGKFDARAARLLRETYVDLVEFQENVVGAIFELTQRRVLTPPEFIGIFYDMLPADAKALKGHMRKLKRLWESFPSPTGIEHYWESVALAANMLSFFALLIGVLLKWTDYGLDEWERAQRLGRAPSPQPLRRLERITRWMDEHQSWISLSDLLVHILRP